MKKIVLTFGLISGAILSLWMLLITVQFHDAVSLEWGMVLGYTSMVLASCGLLRACVLPGQCCRGTVRFGRAFTVGIHVALVSSMFYVATWEGVYFTIAPDFLSKYEEQMLEKARRGRREPEAIAKEGGWTSCAVMYQNPRSTRHHLPGAAPGG